MPMWVGVGHLVHHSPDLEDSGHGQNLWTFVEGPVAEMASDLDSDHLDYENIDGSYTLRRHCTRADDGPYSLNDDQGFGFD